MDDILQDLGLGHLIDGFEFNSITPKVVVSLKDDEFEALGITKIGQRVLLRERCRDYLTASEFPDESPVMKRLRSLQASRKGKSKKPALFNNRKVKETRRICLGWKHFEKGQYKMVTVNKGGGIIQYDFPRTSTLDEMIATCTEQYFPNGINSQSGIAIKDVEYYIANFTGTSVSRELKSGSQFTLGGYVEEVNTSPIRLYLHTKMKLSRPTTISDEELPGPSGSELSERQQSSILTTPDEQTVQPENDSSDFEETDTPTISFRRQPRTRLLPGPSGSELSERQQSSILTTPDEQQRLSLRRSITSQTTGTSTAVVVNDSQSVADHIQIGEGPENFTLKEILKWWTAKTALNDGEETLMLIQRENLLKSTLRIVRRDNFNFCRPPKLTFSGEDGEDFGGPKREFLSLLMAALSRECFQGDGANMFFIHDIEKLKNQIYQITGSLVAFSILHGGPGLPVLHNCVYNFLMYDESENLPPISECILDAEQCRKFETILQASNQEDYTVALNDVSEWAAEQGLSLYKYRQLEEKDNLLYLLKKNEIFYRVHSEIDQFKTGLNKVGLFLETMRMAPEEFRKLFVHQKETLKFAHLRSAYHVNYSLEGSNDRTLEGRALYCLEAFLADCEGGTTGVTLHEVLSFWTGASSLPPLGFHKELEVDFGTEKRLPSAHTCSLVLSIWRGYSDPDVFAEDMVKAVTWGGGFHLV